MNDTPKTLIECMSVYEAPISVRRVAEIIESSTRCAAEIRQVNRREGWGFALMLVVLALCSWYLLTQESLPRIALILASMGLGVGVYSAYRWWQAFARRLFVLRCTQRNVAMAQPVGPEEMATVEAMAEKDQSLKDFLDRIHEERPLFMGEYLAIMAKCVPASNEKVMI